MSCTSVDSRGVERGKCTVIMCDCARYNRGVTGMKCMTCSHLPVKHTNIKAATQQEKGLDAGMYDPSEIVHSIQPQYYPVQMLQTPQLPQCNADGCTNPVYFEVGYPQELQTFDYCSPQCRDRHLLPELRAKLQEDIQVLLEIASHSSTLLLPKSKNGAHLETFEDVKSKKHVKAKKNVEQFKEFSLLANPKSASRQQTSNTFSVVIKKDHQEEKIGIIVSERIYSTDKVVGFMITGLDVKGKAYKSLQDDKLRLSLLDVIQTVNKQPVSDRCQTGSLQKLFDEMTSKDRKVTLNISQVVSSPPISKPLKDALKVDRLITHVLAMRPPENYLKEKYGIRFQQKTSPEVIIESTEGIADRTGLRAGDNIRAYICVTLTTKADQPPVTAVKVIGQEKVFSQLLKDTLTKMAARVEPRAVILFIKRSVVDHKTGIPHSRV